MYECLQGTKPFPTPNLTGVLLRILNEDPAPIDYEKRGLPRALHPVLERSLAKDPCKRFSSAAEFAQALRSVETVTPDGDFFSSRDRADEAGPSSSSTAPDSVADSLMREARETTDIQAHLSALLQEDRVLKITANPLLQFRNVNLTSEEAFILSRIAEAGTAKDIFSVSPLGEEETARALLGFLRTGLVEFENDTITKKSSEVNVSSSSQGKATNADRPEPDEIRRLFRSAQNEDDWQVLGPGSGASLAEIKTAFKSKAFRYHPDRYAHSGEKDLSEKLSNLFRRVSDAFSNLSSGKR